MTALTPDDDKILQMLAGANFGPKANVTLPSGAQLDSSEAQALTSAYADPQAASQDHEGGTAVTTAETDRTNRIATDHDIVAMVAIDTIRPLAERITRMLSHGRRIAIAHRRATYLNDAPEVHAGLTVARNPKLWERDGSSGFNVPLTDGTDGLGYGFGFTVYAGENCDTESEVWRRYHAPRIHAGSHSDRRRNMTEVRIVGGVEGFGPGRGDRIMIRRWNENGVCDETVIAFDNSALNATAA